MLIFTPIEAGVSPLVKTIKTLERVDFCFVLIRSLFKSLLDSNVHVPLSAFTTLLTVLCFCFSQAALSSYFIPLTVST